MTFKIKLENSRILKGIVETLSSIIDETEFRVTPEEFTITAMDPSRICLLKLTINKEDFDEYESEAEAKVGLNLDDLDKILKRSSTNDSIDINFKESDNKIKIIMQREGMSRSRTFSLALLDIDIEEIPMDNLLAIEYPSSWVIDPDFLVEAIKDAEIYSEILNIKAEEQKGLTFSSTGQIGEMVYSLTPEDLIEDDINDESTGAYSLTFLKAILKIASITEKLEISLKTDHPLKMIFNILEGGELSYFLAPRVEEADFDDDDMDEF
ncbi:MAG: proliferating cell nuclear antigen (pcna) [Candidatus Lokiarchaeota archaeon]|nr:proliferating cell nuclear antigen (pcna) [Candidatus Lokiarchaeota archaeon]MBD3200435.1 proliferating cell nuclear antigen (pcna) [Candidatus Lokiarchaeota archaeon]